MKNKNYIKSVSPFQIKKNSSLYSIVSLSVLLGFLSCNQMPQKVDNPEAPVKSSMSLEEVLENNATFSNYSIPPEFSDWPKYHNLYIDIKNLENNAFNLLDKPIEDLDQLFLELKKTIPNLLNETSILSRLKVIETLTYKLRESYSLGLTDSKEFTLTKTELLQAQTNLIFQINKTFEKKKQQITKPI